MVGFIRDQTLSGCTYQEVKEVVGVKGGGSAENWVNDKRKYLCS